MFEKYSVFAGLSDTEKDQLATLHMPKVMIRPVCQQIVQDSLCSGQYIAPEW